MRAGRRLGLEWRDRALTVVEVSAGGDPAVRWARATLRPGEPITAADLAALLESAGIEPGPALLAVAGRSVPIKPVALPPVDIDARLSILAEDGDRFFLLPRGPRSYAILSAPEAEVDWAVAAPAAEIESLMAACADAGVWLRRVTASAAVHPVAVGWLQRTAGESERPVESVVRVGSGRVEWFGYRDGSLADYMLYDNEVPWSLPRQAEAWAGSGHGTALLVDGDEPPAWAAGGEFYVPDAKGRIPHSAVAALGAALVDPEERRCPDLTPARIRRRRARKARRITGALTTALVLLAMLLTALLIAGRRQSERRLADSLAVAREEARPVIDMRAEIERIGRAISAYRKAEAERVDYLGLLRELSLTLPSDAFLAGMEGDPTGRLVLSGYARSATDVVSALAGSQLLEQVRFDQEATRVELGGRRWESFRLSVVTREGRSPERRPAVGGAGEAAEARE